MASAFLDKDSPPAQAQLARVLGTRRALWEQISAFMQEHYQLSGEWKYFGEKSGWDIWFRKAGRTLVQLTPQAKSFSALVVLGSAQAVKANELKFGKKVRGIFDAARPLHDGRWLFIPVTTTRDVQDILQLVQIKRPIKSKR